MRKKILSIISLIFAVFAILTINSTVNAAEPTYNEGDGYVLNGTQKCFFANGTDITIKARTDGTDGATITWDGDTKSVNVPSDINIFGGAHNDPLTYDSKITMNSGTVKNIFGGGLHESYVGTSNVILNGGTVSGSITGGGANVLANSDQCTPKSENAVGSATRVVNANVTINGGSVSLLFGGGEGLGYTKSANTTINGGNIDYVTAGGSNGYTENANLTVTNGEINVFQSVNRGSIDSANVGISGGTIKKLYVGGETDPNVTGTISNISLDITGNAVVENLYLGTSGGATIGTNGNDTIVDVDIHYTANVHIANEAEFTNGMITKFVYVTIDGVRYELEQGKTLSALAELENIKNVKDKKFIKFIIKGTNEEFKEDISINEDIELETVFNKIEPIDNTPKTGKKDLTYAISIIAIIMLVAEIIVVAKIKV